MSQPSKIGRYHVIGRIASGGMAEIFLAKVLGPGGFERPVVIKRVLPHLVNEREFRDMFLDEARIVAAIHHRNVVQVHELGREDDELYLVMEYLAGESVRSLSRRAAARHQPLDLSLCAHIIAEACAGLHAAHEFTGPGGKALHVVHRDVCPNNLFVAYDGSVKVVDFGIAQAVDRYTLTEAGQVKGKAAYMSPEQCLRRPVDRRTDIFALGVVLYELSTGHRLFGGALESRILSCLQQEEVQPPSSVVANYPKELERICMRALRFQADERFASAEEMRVELVRFQRALSGDVLPEQQLQACMHTLFEDRIAEKADLLNRLRDGSGVSQIPTAEISDEVSVPLVETDREAPETKLGRPARDTSEPRGQARSPADETTAGGGTRGRGGSAWFFAIVALVCLAGLGGAVFMTHEANSARQALSLKVARVVPTAPTPTPVAPAAQPVEPSVTQEQAVSAAAALPLPDEVTVQLNSQPPGAGAWIDELYRGQTPLSVTLPRGTTAVPLRLELVGYKALEQPLVPDVDQRFSLSLLPLPEARPDSGTPSEPAAPAPSSSKRRRSSKQAKPGEEFFLFE